MKSAKYVLMAVVGMMTCMPAANGADSNYHLGGSRAELEQMLGFGQENLGVESMLYAKFDAYSTWIEKNIEDNEISPKMGFGFRYRNQYHGFDFSVSRQMPKDFKAIIVSDAPGSPGKQFRGTENYSACQLTYLYYTQPIARSTLYFGTGAGIDRHSIEIKDAHIHDHFGFISGLFIAGYQFKLSNTMKSFLQFQVSQPAYIYQKIDTDIYGLSQVNQWIPTLSMSVGVGF